MTDHRPPTGDHRVLPFRPRSVDQVQPRRGDGAGPRGTRRPAARDLSGYERSPEEPDDYRHRMVTNLAAIAFAAFLTAVGVWLANTLAEMRATQDCVLMGRRDCAHISAQKTDLISHN